MNVSFEKPELSYDGKPSGKECSLKIWYLYHSLNAEDKFWGFDFDAMMADWTATFGYMNPEFTDDLMAECIIKARQAAMSTTDRPVRNIAVIPFHADCPQTFAKLLFPSSL